MFIHQFRTGFNRTNRVWLFNILSNYVDKPIKPTIATNTTTATNSGSKATTVAVVPVRFADTITSLIVGITTATPIITAINTPIKPLMMSTIVYSPMFCPFGLIFKVNPVI